MMGHVNFWNARNNLRNGNACGDPSRAPRCGARRAPVTISRASRQPCVGQHAAGCTAGLALVRERRRDWSAAAGRGGSTGGIHGPHTRNVSWRG
jgi:hypothetical protein